MLQNHDLHRRNELLFSSMKLFLDLKSLVKTQMYNNVKIDEKGLTIYTLLPSIFGFNFPRIPLNTLEPARVPRDPGAGDLSSREAGLPFHSKSVIWAHILGYMSAWKGLNLLRLSKTLPCDLVLLP